MSIDTIKYYKTIQDLKAYGYTIELIYQYIEKLERNEIIKRRKKIIKNLLVNK